MFSLVQNIAFSIGLVFHAVGAETVSGFRSFGICGRTIEVIIIGFGLQLLAGCRIVMLRKLSRGALQEFA